MYLTHLNTNLTILILHCQSSEIDVKRKKRGQKEKKSKENSEAYELINYVMYENNRNKITVYNLLNRLKSLNKTSINTLIQLPNSQEFLINMDKKDKFLFLCLP